MSTVYILRTVVEYPQMHRGRVDCPESMCIQVCDEVTYMYELQLRWLFVLVLFHVGHEKKSRRGCFTVQTNER
jgi:hypothetical protein